MVTYYAMLQCYVQYYVHVKVVALSIKYSDYSIRVYQYAGSQVLF